MLNTNDRIKTGKRLAIISFLVGTAIIVAFYITFSFELAFIGLGFILAAAFANFAVLLAVLNLAWKNKEQRVKALTTAGIMLLNIPAMLVYCNFTLTLMNTLRINFINDTGSPISDINIIGCAGGHINKLDAGEDKTVWISITGDCSVHIDYLLDGERKSETVVGYATTSGGTIGTHRIDGHENELIQR